MHTLTAIGMAILFVVLVYIIILLLYIPFAFLYKVYHYIKSDMSGTDTKKDIYSGYFTNKKFLKTFTYMFFMVHIIAYSSERLRLVSDERAYLDAKEYFAASGVVTLYRKILNNYVEVDNLIMIPLNSAHMMFYKKGIELIPKTDGEYDYWKYRFNLYYYVRKHYVPWDDDKSGYMFGTRVYKFYKPVIRELMDESYTIMQAMMQKPFKDKVLLNERYRLLTRLAEFYEIYVLKTYQFHCAPWIKCTVLYANDTVLPKKDELVLEYIQQALNFFKKHNIEGRVSHITDALLVQELVITRHLDEIIGKGLFTCDNHYVKEYIRVHKEFEKLTKDREYTSLSKELREKLYEARFFSSEMTCIVNYLVKRDCNTELIYKSPFPLHCNEQKLIKKIKDKFHE